MTEAQARIEKRKNFLGQDEWKNVQRDWRICQVCKEVCRISHRYMGGKVRLKCTCGFSLVIEEEKLGPVQEMP